MKNKSAQHTQLDVVNRGYPSSYYNDTNPILPFEEKDKWDMQVSQRELAQNREEKLREEKYKKPIPLNYPELNQEHIRYRNLSPEEIERLNKQEDNDKMRGYYYNAKEYEKTKHLNETLTPEEAKKQLFDVYKEFKETASIFYKCYKEANEFASEIVSINYNSSYLQIIKDFPKYLINVIKRQIGALFGLVPEGRRYRHDSRIRSILHVVNKGINLFNVTAETFDQTMIELRATGTNMKFVIAAYEKRKKLLIKLPGIIESSSKEFLAKTKNRDFLKWMEEYFPNDKEDFIQDSIAGLYYSYSNDRQERKYFSIGDLDRIKSYKSIYEKIPFSSGENIYRNLQYKVEKELRETLVEEAKKRVEAKINNLKNILSNYSNYLKLPAGVSDQDIDLKELYNYCNKILKLDLKSIINFTNSMLDNYYKDKEKSNNPHPGLVGMNYKNAFLEIFLVNINDKFSKFKKDNYIFSIKDIINDLIQKHTKDGIIQHKEFNELNEKDLDDYINEFLRNVIINSMPNYKGGNLNRSNYFPSFIVLGDIIKERGKFTVDSVMNYIHKSIPFVPRDFILHLSRFLFKGASESDSIKAQSFIKEIGNLRSSESMFSMRILLDILEKSGKLNPNTFVQTFVDHFKNLQETIRIFRRDLGRMLRRKKQSIYGTPEHLQEKNESVILRKIFLTAIRSAATIEQDLKNLEKFITFAHNDAADLGIQDLNMILKNVNFHSFSKINIIKKLLSTYSKIKSNGSPSGIKKKYGRIINDLIKSDYISKNFYENVELIYRFFLSNQGISPASEYFKKLSEAASSVETDLEIIEMGGTFKELLKDYEPKDKRLFNLNLNVGNRLRFSVLKDKDPRILRIGIETNCCQRIGGAAESSAKDSFVNPLAGVVILEWKNNDGEWILLSQSYFHYIPDDNSYILDNVEKNSENVKESGIELDPVYAYLAAYVKSKFDVKYFLAGKGYSKLNGLFEDYNIEDGEDPRYFNPKAKEQYRDNVYTDFRPHNSMNLLAPTNENPLKKFKSSIGEMDDKLAFKINLRKIIFGNALVA